MTEREEIREELISRISTARKTKVLDGNEFDQEFVDNMLTYLHSQGVVIRVDRELPKLKRRFRGDYNTGYAHCRQDAIEAGCVATKPLIEEAG